MGKYYWMKMHDNFFDRFEIKKLRKIPGGDTYTIIYLKLLILSLNTDGKIPFERLESNIVKEIALKINEDDTSVEMAVNALQMLKLLEEVDGDVELPEHSKVTGNAKLPPPSRKALPNKIKKSYGQYNNVKLSDDDLQKLADFFGSDIIRNQKIEDMSLYLKSKGDKYKDHCATLMTWGRKDGFGTKKRTPKKKFDVNDWV